MDEFARRTYNAKEVAKMFGVSVFTIYEGAKLGDLPVIRIGGRVLFSKSKIDALLGIA